MWPKRFIIDTPSPERLFMICLWTTGYYQIDVEGSYGHIVEKYRLSSSTYDTWTLRLDRHWQSSCNPVDCQCRFTTLSFMLYPNFCYSYIGQPTHINRTTVSNDLSLAVIRAELARWMTSDSSFLPNRVHCKSFSANHSLQIFSANSLQILCKFSASSSLANHRCIFTL